MNNYYKLKNGKILCVDLDDDFSFSPRQIYDTVGTMYNFNNKYISPDGKSQDLYELAQDFAIEVFNRRGMLYSENDVIKEVEDVIFRDPDTNEFSTKSDYLVNYLAKNGYAVADNYVGDYPDRFEVMNVATPEEIFNEYGSNDLESLKMAENELGNEIEEFDLWCRGQEWGYTLYETNGEEIDSCGGYLMEGSDAVAKYVAEEYGTEVEADLGTYKDFSECVDNNTEVLYQDAEDEISEQHANAILNRYSDAELRGMKKAINKKSLSDVKKSVDEAKKHTEPVKNNEKKKTNER